MAGARPTSISRKDIRREEFYATNIDPGGWDLKFFWCPNEDDPDVELFNYRQALSFANAFANLAGERRNIIPGTPIGSVRVGPVSDNLRRLVNVSHERWVTWDEGPGEEAMATAVMELVAGTAKQEFRIFRSTGTPSPFYTSVFSCSTAIPAANRAVP